MLAPSKRYERLPGVQEYRPKRGARSFLDLPVLEIGPAPPRAASQTIISYSLAPPLVELVNISYETSATMSLPV